MIVLPICFCYCQHSLKVKFKSFKSTNKGEIHSATTSRCGCWRGRRGRSPNPIEIEAAHADSPTCWGRSIKTNLPHRIMQMWNASMWKIQCMEGSKKWMHIPAAAEPKQNRIDDAGAWKKNCKKGQFVSSCNSMHSPICPPLPSSVITRLLREAFKNYLADFVR